MPKGCGTMRGSRPSGSPPTDEVLRQARLDSEEIKREADSYADAVRREAQQESEWIGTDREEVLREAKGEADRIRAAAETDTRRQRDETERVLLKARGDAERMLSAAVSRRDLVKAEMQAMRERLVGVIELLEPAVDRAGPAPAEATAVEAEQVELKATEGEEGNGSLLVHDGVETRGAKISQD